MSLRKSKSPDYPNVAPAKNGRGAETGDYNSLAPAKKKELSVANELQNFSSKKKVSEETEIVRAAENKIPLIAPSLIEPATAAETENLSYAEEQKLNKKTKQIVSDEKLLSGDNWLARNGHIMTYIGLYLFSVFVFFRPYEWYPQLVFLQSGAFFLALATLLVFFPTQLIVEGSPTIFTTEVKSILFLTAVALLSVVSPMTKDHALAWETFNDPFIKAVLMFIVMVNVLRTRRRLLGIMWISFGISLVLSYIAIGMYMRGELKSEGFRVEVNFGGMLGNPNDMALHLVTMTPLAICLGLAAKNKLMKLVYFAAAFMFVAGNMVTFSRGGFLGLIVASAILAWKIGRKQRFNTVIAAVVIGVLFILLAPGNYGLRLLSIFVPGMDSGSSNQRQESLILSIIVTLRNPWGIGMGCFPIVGIQNLQTHNAFTQVSSELGLQGLAAYLVFMLSPLKKLAAVERTLIEKDESGWHYYMAIGLQASIAGFMVSSFFDAVAYNWFIYYLVAYAVSFRRIYRIEKGENTNQKLLPQT